MKPIGPTFSAELEAAGLLRLPIAWGDDGVIHFGEGVTPEQQAAVEAVYEAHNPDALVAPAAVERANVTATTDRTRADALAVIERKIAAGAPQAEINTDLLNLLKEQP
jgi:hypothetical protein